MPPGPPASLWTFSLVLLLSHFCWCSSYTNPVLATNSPDPGVVALPTGGYLAVTTSNWAVEPLTEPIFPIYYSEDLVNWELKSFGFPAGSWPVWASKDMWAPEIHWVRDRYLLYYCGAAHNGRHSIGVAASTTDSPYGPYIDLGVPLVYHNEDSVAGPIDPSYFSDPTSGRHFLVWKTDHMVNISPSQVLVQELAEDGMSFVAGSKPIPIMRDDNYEEELGIVEGPQIVYSNGTYFLFYSSSLFFLPSYHMGVARSEDLLGPYTKRDNPIIQTDWDRYNTGTNSTWEGPGHGSVVIDPSGKWWLAYHAWQYGHLAREPGRLMLLDQMEWVGFPGTHLWPTVVGGVPSDTQREGP